MKKNTKKKNGPAVLSAEEMEKTIGKGLSFAAAEAYKLLRINLSFSLPKNSNCQVIGVTSSLRGEGKSTTSINIAYTMRPCLSLRTVCFHLPQDCRPHRLWGRFPRRLSVL